MMRILPVTLVVCTFTAVGFAQNVRKPGAEHARMGYFAGDWKVEGESEGLKYTLQDTCEWFEGGFHLVCRSEGGGAFGKMKGQAVFAFDRISKSYTLFTMNNLGNGFVATGSVSDKVWTWNAELAGPQGPIKARLTMTEESPNAYRIVLHGQIGQEWAVLEESRATKVVR
jgi:hypothetical protein